MPASIFVSPIVGIAVTLLYSLQSMEVFSENSDCVVDRILDMCRTVLNVTGDVTCAAYVARAEGSELEK